MSASTLSASTPAVARSRSSLAAAGHAEGAEAASSAVQRAVSGLDGAAPSLVLVFPDGGLDAAEQLTQAVANAAGAPVAGMTGSGTFGGEGPLERGCSALAFGSGLEAAVGVVPNASRDLRTAAGTAAKTALRDLGESDGGNVLMALSIDTASGDHADVVAGAFEAVGPSVPLVGGGAGGDSIWQLAEGKARKDAVVAVALRSPGRSAWGTPTAPCPVPARRW